MTKINLDDIFKRNHEDENYKSMADVAKEIERDRKFEERLKRNEEERDAKNE